MRGSISKALLLSFLGHYLFVLVFLQFEKEPSIEKSLPVVNVELQARDIGIDTDDTTTAEPEAFEGTNAGSSGAGRATPEQVTNPVSVAGHAVAQEQRTASRAQSPPPAMAEATRPAPARFSAEAEAPAENPGAMPGESVAVLATIQSGWVHPRVEQAPARPEPRKVPVSDPDRSMLEEKLQQWEEDFFEMAEEPANLAWQHAGQSYTASFSQVPAEGDMRMGHVVVEVTKDTGGTRYTTRMHMKNLAFSNYSQFVNRWNPNVSIHDDESDGRFHSNSEVSLLYTSRIQPTFFGKVTTSFPGINTSGSLGRFRRDQIFVGGIETGVRRIDMPKRYTPFPGAAPTETGLVQFFEEDTRITFYPDGSYGWKHIDSDKPELRIAMAGEATYLVGAKKVSMHLSGVVDGRVLVYTPEKIVIEDDLVYAEQPDAMPESNDYLGLVTDRTIEIAGPELTGPGDLLINAAMYARRRFIVTDHKAENDGALSIHGSLAAGTMSATEPRYSTRIRFDQRLEELRPPRFPLTNRYETVAWDGEWNVQEPGSR